MVKCNSPGGEAEDWAFMSVRPSVGTTAAADFMDLTALMVTTAAMVTTMNRIAMEIPEKAAFGTATIINATNSIKRFLVNYTFDVCTPWRLN